MPRETVGVDAESAAGFLPLRSVPSQTLLFPPSLESISLRLVNDNCFPLLFKLKTTLPEVLVSQPARGFIPSQSVVHCQLTPLERRPGLLLVVQSAGLVNEVDGFLTQWQRLKAERIHRKRFSCLFPPLEANSSLLKPILFTVATLTLLSTFIYLKK